MISIPRALQLPCIERHYVVTGADRASRSSASGKQETARAGTAPQLSNAVNAVQIKALYAVSLSDHSDLQVGNKQTVSITGYLYKYSERPGSWLAGLLNKEWNLRWFCLNGNTLQYFKTEQAAGGGHPRGHIELQVWTS